MYTSLQGSRGYLCILQQERMILVLIAKLKLITNMKISIVKYTSEDLDKLILQAYRHLNFIRAIEKLKKEIKEDEV